MVRKKPRRNFSAKNDFPFSAFLRDGKERQGHIWCHDGKECRVINHSASGTYNMMYTNKYLIHYLYIFLAGALFLWFIAFQRR